ncbi:MAG: hypothetical protein US25_C0006G0015 [Candidatus Moranbacteria bacterium GW2011_GWE1_36_7]|nr:MAG: hypothetical protein UR99_C0002G0010 [Candidatus Moranbacteria bacterium GW2011_GWD2_36_12]KKQ07035.1 MAG: hypothetical protein US16_C0003G0010 [Candidatus Moranbacteria bacterium GW2011_GWE2_36_40]KKQ15387.1 MAG: hypothetical protein US25_C0006G0015 [Candidatus Moranbacteria bacterium GW2011_GWE1_36_7]
MTRKYIQNCTGKDCDGNNGDQEKVLISRKLARVIFYVLVVGFFAVLGYVLLFSAYLSIEKVEIAGVVELSETELQQKIKESFEGKFAGIIPRNNYLFISQNSVEKLLKNDFKKIRKLEVKKNFPSDVFISIDERKALMVWCCQEKCFLLDENGIAYSEADFNSLELQQNNLLRVVENGGQSINVGEKIIESSYEQYVLATKESLKKFGYDTLEEYSTPSRMAEEVRVKTAQGPEFLFSTQFSLESALRNLTVVLEKEIPKDKRNEIAYMDLRNESKLFYKFKDIESLLPEDENTEDKKNME